MNSRAPKFVVNAPKEAAIIFFPDVNDLLIV